MSSDLDATRASAAAAPTASTRPNAGTARASERPGLALDVPPGTWLAKACAPAASTAGPLRGRSGELVQLNGLLTEMRRGTGATWLIEGAPGLGKSRLIGEAMSAARTAGFSVGHCVAQPDDSAVHLAVLMGALFEGAAPVLDRSGLPESHLSPDRQYWLVDDLQLLLEQAALRRPVMICLDDAQWADSGTIAAVRRLSARLTSAPVGWVLANRPVDPDSRTGRAAADFMRAGAAMSLISRLDQAAVADITADMLGAPPDSQLLALVASAGGHPRWLCELLAGLQEEQLIEFRAGRAVLAGPGTSRRLLETMQRRLAGMSSTARTAAAVAASMGPRFRMADLAAVLGTPASALLDPVRELVGAGLLVEGEDALSFSHDLNRQVVRDSQPPSAVHALDRQVATSLLAAGALPVEVARQVASSAAPGDELAITTLMRASDSLSGTNPGQAADLAVWALDLAAERHPLRGPLTARTAILLHAGGRIDDARTFADSALLQALPAAQEAEVRLAVASMFTVSPELRAESCRRALALPGLPDGLQARLRALLLHNTVVAGRPSEAPQLLAEARQAVTETGDGAARFSLQVAEAVLDYIRGDFGAALTGIDAALRSATYPSVDPREYQARAMRCWMLATLDRHDEGLASAGSGIRSAQQAGQARALQLFDAAHGRQLLQVGRLSDAAAVLQGRVTPEAADLVISALDADAVVTFGRVALHTASHRHGQLAAAVAQVMLASGVPGVQRHAAWLLALQAHAAGQPAEARKRLTALGHDERLSVFPLFPLDVADDPQLVRIAMASGDLELAESVTEAAERRADANPGLRSVLASAAHARGLLAADRQNLARAVAILEPGPRRLATASAMEDLAVAETRTGRAKEAIAALDAALAIYAGCGARWDATRVRKRLRQLGIHRRLSTARRPAQGWDAITDSELAVCRLVAAGLTNRETAERLYISPHTVNGHLRHAFQKLGINSRVALTRIAAGHPERE
jgi:DNA-binding CsgD family transcriptional regulator